MPEVRPIDANKLREEIMTENYDNDTINNFLDLVDLAPTLDNEPVVHAHWESERLLNDTRCDICSNCHWGVIRDAGSILYKRCPECGAKMDEEQK